MNFNLQITHTDFTIKQQSKSLSLNLVLYHPELIRKQGEKLVPSLSIPCDFSPSIIENMNSLKSYFLYCRRHKSGDDSRQSFMSNASDDSPGLEILFGVKSLLLFKQSHEEGFVRRRDDLRPRCLWNPTKNKKFNVIPKSLYCHGSRIFHSY